jgi:hypothetical protein
MCAEKANISHKQLWDGTSKKNATFAHKTFFSIGKSRKISANQCPVAPLIFSAGGRNNIVYSSEWLSVWNTSVITKTK